MERHYSIRHLGLFSQPILQVRDDGFHYKGRLYTHVDIKAVNVTGGFGQPQRMGIHLKDRQLILINAAALELNGRKAKTGFLSGGNNIFDELKDYFLELKRKQQLESHP